ncbi:MAG: biopolymer transporter ExbD [Rhodanobacteraceae bacterium]|jgi:biopolymer transport protein ExbD|nr:biopolymer transporter ExbD [Rhodanobacteraceae bacterium]
MRALRSDASAVQAQINVTPLIDVMLVLLMILMLTTPLALHRVPLPLGANAGNDVPRMLALSVKASGELYLDGGAVNRAQLATALAAAAVQDQPPLLEIRPEANTRYDYVAEVLVLAGNSGLSAIRVVGAQ